MIDTAKRQWAGKVRQWRVEDFQTIVSRNADAMVVLDHEGCVLYVNPAAEALFSLPSAEMIGASFGFPLILDKPLELCITREFKDFVAAEMRMVEVVWAGEPSYLLSFRNLTDRIIAEQAISRARDELDARVKERTRELSESNERLAREVAERKRAEESLKLTGYSLDRARDAIIWFYPDGRIFYANDAARTTFGYPREELLALTIFDLNPHYSRENWNDRWRALKSKGSTLYEVENRAKDGHWFPLEVSNTFIKYDDKEFMFGYARDITERRRVEEAIRDERSQLLSIFDSIDEITYVADPQTYEILYANKAMQDKFDKSLVGGICYRELQGKDAPCEFCTNPIIFKDRGVPYRWEYRNPILGRDFLIVDRAIKWPDGRDVRFELAIDITERKRAEEALRRSEEKFRVMAETANAGIVLFRGDHFIYVNPIMEKALGYTKEELLAMNYWDIVHPDMRDLVRSVGFARQNGRAVPSTYEFKVRTKGGETRWVELSAAMIDYIGEETGIGTVFDVTERKRAEEALRDSQAYMSSIFRAAPTGIGVVVDRVIKKANDRLCEMTGYAREELIGKSARILYPGDEDYEYVGREKYGQISRRGTGSVETRWRRKDGRIIDVLLSSTPLDIDNLGAGVTFTALDITERKRAEEELKESEERYKLVAIGAQGAIWDWDVPNRRVFFSPRWKTLRGLSDDEVTDREEEWRSRIHPEDAPRVLAAVQAHLDGKTPFFAQEYRTRRKDGSWLWISDRGMARRDAAGRVVRMAGSENDISERKRAEMALNEAKQQAELYLDLMGHDISNMHQIMLGNLEIAQGILEIDGKLESNNKELIDTSVATLLRSARLIEDIRNLQKLRRGEFELKVTDLGEVLDEAVKGYTRLPGREVSVSFEPAARGCHVTANALLKDVFNNLIENALKHCDGPVQIGVSLAPAELKGRRYYRVVVEDNGRGVPDPIKPSVFSRLERGDARARGTGLGLYVVKTLVEGFGGTVSVEDRVPGDHAKGARFVVTLPVA